ncbi:hypothetical protein [Nonomuraea glycinis]|uniref:hypothetical protein n=1 Tax=Nonomuraea glycinis TaxID=2047744 RepID=UPI002E14AC0A|nr:hypothetical protein OHA68_35950 [Nonomuraea glycinis]
MEELSERIWLKSYRRLGYFPKLKDAPDAVVEPVRDALNFPASVAAEVDAVRTAKRQRDLVRKRLGLEYNAAQARGIEQAARAVGLTPPAQAPATRWDLDTRPVPRGLSRTPAQVILIRESAPASR